MMLYLNAFGVVGALMGEQSMQHLLAPLSGLIVIGPLKSSSINPQQELESGPEQLQAKRQNEDAIRWPLSVNEGWPIKAAPRLS